MSKVVSMRLKDGQVERLQRVARRLGRSQSETAALVLEEALRQREFAFIEFRDSPAGRQAYLQGTRLAVWHVLWLYQQFGRDVERVAEQYELPPVQLAAALRYAEAYAEEIEAAMGDRAYNRDHLRELIPGLEIVHVDTSGL